MIQTIKRYLLGFSAALMLAMPGLIPVTVSAACSDIGNQVSKGAEGAASGSSVSTCGSATGVDETGVSSAAHKIVNLFSVIVGIIAIIMIIYGGFRYITSGGDSGRVGNAKNTLIYAVIGLVIVALAQIIVRFVLNQSSNLTT
jgi:hypothetical protein